MSPEYVGQNQDSRLHPKKSGVIFFQPKILTPKHSVESISILFEFISEYCEGTQHCSTGNIMTDLIYVTFMSSPIDFDMFCQHTTNKISNIEQ